MICQQCGVDAPTQSVVFHEHIGAYVFSIHKRVQGRWCKTCIWCAFKRMTGKTALLGWWAFPSFIMTPGYLFINIWSICRTRKLESVPDEARVPYLSNGLLRRLNPHADFLIARLRSGEDYDACLLSMAETAGTTPGEVAIFVHAVGQRHAKRDHDHSMDDFIGLNQLPYFRKKYRRQPEINTLDSKNTTGN